MPVGVIVDALAVVIGGIVGAVAGKKLKKDFIDNTYDHGSYGLLWRRCVPLQP